MFGTDYDRDCRAEGLCEGKAGIRSLAINKKSLTSKFILLLLELTKDALTVIINLLYTFGIREDDCCQHLQ